MLLFLVFVLVLAVMLVLGLLRLRAPFAVWWCLVGYVRQAPWLRPLSLLQARNARYARGVLPLCPPWLAG